MGRARPLQCPFCGSFLIRPVDIELKTVELTGGICTCGAVYAFDRTGHNLGEIYLNALTFLCRGDIDRAMSLGPEDYDDVDCDYDYQMNMVDARSLTGRTGKLIFLKLKTNQTHESFNFLFFHF